MHDILRERVWRRLEALPQEQLYQVLDYMEFLEAKYAAAQARQPDPFQRFAERLEDGMRLRSVAPRVINASVGLFGTARKVVQTVSDAAGTVLGAPPDASGRPPARVTDATRPADASRGMTPGGSTPPAGGSTPSAGGPPPAAPGSGSTPPRP